MKQLLIFLTLLAGSITFSFAQFENPVSWTFQKEQISETEFDLVYTAEVEKKWYVYGQNIDEGGPIPTTFEYETLQGAEIQGKATEKGDLLKEYSKVFNMNVEYYKGKVTFRQRVKLTADQATVGGYLTFMTCNEITCLPPTDVDFSFNLKPKKAEETVVSEPESQPVNPPSTNTEENLPVDESLKAENNPEKVFPELDEETKPSFDDPDKTVNVIGENLENVGLEAENPSDEILKPVSWTASVNKQEDGNLEMQFDAKVIEGWVVYSLFQNPDEGPLPTVIVFEDESAIQKIGEPNEEGGKSTGYDKMFDMEVTKFKKNLTIRQIIKPSSSTTPLIGYVDYMTCNDSKCIPASFEFSLDQDGKPIAGSISNPGKGPNMVDGSRFGEPVQDCGEALEFGNLWITFIKGFIGGLIALLTPCVFPMIPLTVSFFTKQSKTKSAGIRNALIYGVSIIVIYVALGTSLTAIFGAQIMNELSTNMFLNLLFFALFVVFAISFFGFFEITLPSSWANRTDRMADRGGFLGIFFMAFTLGIVSFSCTGPIIGTLLIEAFKSDGAMIAGFNIAPPIGMLGFSTALALPFTLFAAFPGWLNSLPRSGGWMVTVKVVLGFLELALALKFLSLVDMTQHWNLLRFEPFMALWILFFTGLGLYLFGYIKFPHDPPKPKIGITRGALGALSLVFSVYLVYGLVNYKSLNLLSGLAPPAHYNYFNPSDCPLGLDCYKDYDEGLAEAQKTGKPILIDFTGYGCVNCRKMEETVWPKKQILKKLQEEFVVISLYVDDRTKLPEPYISPFDGGKKRTIGNKWADFQAIHFGANSQPYYVLVSPEEQLLNLPVGYTPNVEEFNYFLECGLGAFDQLGDASDSGN